MTAKYKVAMLIGSLRKASFNRKAAHALLELAPAALDLEIIAIADLALYNEDLEKAENLPASWAAFRASIKAAHAVLFVTPEYNRSVPAPLKNAIDVGSRPYGKSVWDGKPAAVMSVSPGAIGGFGANHHLRQSLVFLNMPVLQQPEAYIGGAGSLFDEAGKLAKDDTRKFFATFMEKFAAWIDLVRK